MKKLSLVVLMLFSTKVLALSCGSGSKSGELMGAAILKPFIIKSCEQVRDSKVCQDLASDLRSLGVKPETKLLQCDNSNLTSRLYESNWGYVPGCAMGGWDFVAGSFVSLGTALGEGAAQVVLDYQKEKAANAVCDLNPKTKPQLISEYNLRVPKALKVPVPDQKSIEKLDCAGVKSALQKWRLQKANLIGGQIQAKIMTGNLNYSAEEQEFIKWGQNPQNQKDQNLLAAAKAKLNEMKIQWQCYNSVQSAAMICEAILEVASVGTGVAAIAMKAARLKNIAKIAGLSESQLTAKVSRAAVAGAEFKTGIIPVADSSVTRSFIEKFGKESGVFYRGIRVPKGTPVQEYYIRSDGLGSMVSTKAEDAFHYGKSPAGLKTNKLNPDDEVVVMSYELKPYHIQEDPYGTLEHVFVDPNVNLKSGAIKYKEIRIPAKELDNPQALEKYLKRLSQGH